MMKILDDGTGVLGAATPHGVDTPPPPPPPSGDVDPAFVQTIAAATIDEIRRAIAAGRVTLEDVLAAEDPDNGGRGRAGVRELAAG